MAKKRGGMKPNIKIGKIYIKFVKAANMFCKTWFTEEGLQKQEWISKDKI